MNRSLTLLAAAAGLALARPALATDDADTTQTSTTTSTTTTPAPTNHAKPPTLPSTASDRATFVHENIAFGKNGAEERAEHRHVKGAKVDKDDANKADADDSAKTEAAGAAKSAVHDALADKASIPAKRPTLPSTASERAVYVHDNIAFGKKGEAERAAHRQAGKQGGTDADDAHADMANRAAHGAAGDMQREMDDNHSAASMQRDHREGMPSGGGSSPMMPKGH